MTSPRGEPLELIVCQSRNGVIGDKGKLPWRLPEDMIHFRTCTTGAAIIMGRKTFESIGRALPNRYNIVLTRQQAYEDKLATPVESNNIRGVPTLATGVRIARLMKPGRAPMIIGGAAVYREALPLVTKMYVTTYERDVEGDTRFPEINHDHWVVDSTTRLGPEATLSIVSRRPSSLLDL